MDSREDQREDRRSDGQGAGAAEGPGAGRREDDRVDGAGERGAGQGGTDGRAGTPVDGPVQARPDGPADIRPARTVAELVAAEALFDGPVRQEWAERFLAAPGHLMLIAYVGGQPAGMVSGIEMTHPDKGTEMCLYELSVAEEHRRRGIGRALTDALAEAARARGCHGMWVGVDTDNAPALATYASAGSRDEGVFAMLGWEFRPVPPAGADEVRGA